MSASPRKRPKCSRRRGRAPLEAHRARADWRSRTYFATLAVDFLTLGVKQPKVNGLRAAIARSADVICERLACHQYLHAGGLDVVDMHKNIGAATIGSDKAISAICVEEFNPPTWHCSFNPIKRTPN